MQGFYPYGESRYLEDGMNQSVQLPTTYPSGNQIQEDTPFLWDGMPQFSGEHPVDARSSHLPRVQYPQQYSKPQMHRNLKQRKKVRWEVNPSKKNGETGAQMRHAVNVKNIQEQTSKDMP